MAIDKLISKFEKVKKSINSIKGIRSKIQSFNYTTAFDALEDEARENYESLIKDRKSSLVKGGTAQNEVARRFGQKAPKDVGPQLIYPEYDALSNWIVFTSMPRRDRLDARETSTGKKHPVFTEREVALYVPDTLISQAGVTYTADGISAMQRALANIGEAARQGDLLGKGLDESKKMIVKFIGESFNKATGGYFNAARGRAGNPLQEQLLTGIPFRSWDFTFDFFPKTRQEAKKVNEIIYFFRSSMLPDAYTASYKDLTGQGGGGKDKGDVDNNASYLNYPNIFNIRFEGPLGNKIDGFLPAVCANAQVDYAGGQKFSTHNDGQPMHLQLTLNFLEIQTMTLGNYENTVSKLGDPKAFAINDTIVNKQYLLKKGQYVNENMEIEDDPTLKDNREEGTDNQIPEGGKNHIGGTKDEHGVDFGQGGINFKNQEFLFHREDAAVKSEKVLFDDPDAQEAYESGVEFFNSPEGQRLRNLSD